MIFSVCVCMKIYAPLGKFEVVSDILEARCLAKVTTD